MPPPVPRLRADARDNRERILAAARSLLAERGPDVAMRDVARRAAVGPATLYRRFPTKQDLLDEVFAAELETCRGIVVQGCADHDAWRGFTTVVRRLATHLVENRAFVDAVSPLPEGGGPLLRHRRELLGMLTELGRRAQTEGRLRPDFVVDDLVLVLHAGRGLAGGGAQAAQRFAELMIDAFSARTPAR